MPSTPGDEHIVAHSQFVLKQHKKSGGNIPDQALGANADGQGADAGGGQHAGHGGGKAQLPDGDGHGDEIKHIFGNALAQGYPGFDAAGCRIVVGKAQGPAFIGFLQHLAGELGQDPGQHKGQNNIDQRGDPAQVQAIHQRVQRRYQQTHRV